MLEERDIERNIEEYYLGMFKEKTIKDVNSENGYSLGLYNNKVAFDGFYLDCKNDCLLYNIEKMAKKKFQLERDSENYVQEARLELWLSMKKIYGNMELEGKLMKNSKLDGLIYKDVQYKLMDKAKLAKSNVSTCDRHSGKYHVNKIESFEQKFIEEPDKLKNQRDEKYIHEIYNVMSEEKETTSKFKKWLDKNEEYILTKKQRDYIHGDVVINDASGEWRMRKNIIMRIEEAYSTDMAKIERLNALKKQLRAFEYVLDFKEDEDLIDRILKSSKKKTDVINSKLYEYLNMEDCYKLTELLNEEYTCLEDKEFMYNIVNILIDEENKLNEMINSLKGVEENGFN